MTTSLCGQGDVPPEEREARLVPARVTALRRRRSSTLQCRLCNQCHYSVPARLIGRRVRVSLRASELVVFDGRTEAARHARSVRKGSTVLVLDHYLEILARQPGALPGATALAQAHKNGTFTHDAFWALACKTDGDRDGTKAMVEVLLLHRWLTHADVVAGLAAAVSVGSANPFVVGVEARKAAKARGAGGVEPPPAGGHHHVAAAAGRPYPRAAVATRPTSNGEHACKQHPTAMVTRGNAVIDACTGVLDAVSERAPARGPARLREAIVGRRADKDQAERLRAAIHALAVARRDYAALVRTETGKDPAELFFKAVE